MSIKNEMRLDFPALGENEAFARMAISAFLLPLNPTIEELADVKTAVSEAVTNAIVHGYAGGRGTVRMHAYYTDETVLTVDIIDRGCGIADIEHAREPARADDAHKAGQKFHRERPRRKGRIHARVHIQQYKIDQQIRDRVIQNQQPADMLPRRHDPQLRLFSVRL